MKLCGLIVLEGSLTCRTGLHIGALVETFVVGRTDSPVIRDAYHDTPYIPGTSLRGKLRALLERFIYTQQGQHAAFFQSVRAGTKDVNIHSCAQPDCPVCRLFGNTPIEQKEAAQGKVCPGALHVENLYPSGSKPEFETKTENALDRTTQSANPRSIERVRAETTFNVRMSYFVRDPDHLETDLRNLATSIALLQDDHLGGGGSRGSGAVELKITKAIVRSFEPTSEQSYNSLKELIAQASGIVQQLKAQSPAPASLLSSSSSDRQTWIVRLKFRVPLHIGEPGIGVESSLTYIPSDTLFSALCHAWLAAFGQEDLEKLLGEFLKDPDPPFVLSSAYPYFNNQLYLPKPYIPPRPHAASAQDEEQAFEKSPIKDLDFIPIEIFAQWLQKGLDEKVDAQLTEKTRDLAAKPLYKEALVPRVRIDRSNYASDLYFCGVVEYPPEGGLYVLIEGHSDLESRLKTCFDLLGELGVGGERSAGCGKFEIRGWQAVSQGSVLETLIKGREGQAQTAYCTLSLFHPRSAELDLMATAAVSYAVTWRGGGWATLVTPGQPQRRQACRMFKEGSVFAFKAGNGSIIQPIGQLVKIAPEVYRSGLAFAVPVYRSDLNGGDSSERERDVGEVSVGGTNQDISREGQRIRQELEG